MKKLFLAFVLILSSVAFVGCQKSNISLVKANMSEMTTNYFYGENEKFSVSISVGGRENNYLVDGVHHEVVDFSLIVFKDKTNKIKDKELQCNLIINEEESSLKLVYNPIANAFMFDLGYELSQRDKICLVYNTELLNVNLISDNFEISHDQAIEKSCQNFETIISKNSKNGKEFFR